MRNFLTILAAFIRRDWMTSRSYRLNFALGVLYLGAYLSLFFFLARFIDEASLSRATGVEGGYFPFVTVGLALITVMEAGVSVFADRLRGDQRTGTLEALMVAPAPQHTLIIGSAAYALLRSAFEAVALFLVAIVAFGVRPTIDLWSVTVLVITLPATLVLFAALGIAVAGMTIIFRQINSLLAVISTLLGILAGAYFPVDVLPGVLHTLAEAFPFTWSLDLSRAALLGGEPSLRQLGGLVAVSAVCLPLALWSFRIALDHARRRGTLGLY